MNKIKKVAGVVTVAATTTLIAAQSAFATGTADAGVTSGFQSATDGITATLTAVAPIVVPIMIALLGWKYGRKIFSQIAK